MKADWLTLPLGKRVWFYGSHWFIAVPSRRTLDLIELGDRVRFYLYRA